MLRSLALTALLVCGARSGLSSAGLLHAHEFLDALHDRAGRRLTVDEMRRDVKSKIDMLYRSVNDPRDQNNKPEKRVSLIRDWVKSVGPLLGRAGWREDAPLHTVMERANELLGRDASADHVHNEAKEVITTMAEFMQTVVNAYKQLPKDEL